MLPPLPPCGLYSDAVGQHLTVKWVAELQMAVNVVCERRLGTQCTNSGFSVRCVGAGIILKLSPGFLPS